MRAAVGLAFVASGAAVAGLLIAQPPQTAIRVATRLVEVNVSVRDKNGPLAGLTKDDFAVFDQGKRQNIAVFSAIGRSAAPQPAHAQPANFFTNRIDERAEAPSSVSVILLDGINTAAEDQIWARQQVEAFLRRMRPRDRIAIYALGYSIQVLQDLTGDPAQLAAALARYRPITTAHLDASNPRPIDADPLFAREAHYLDLRNKEIANDFEADRARLTAAALEAIAGRIGRLPGRKSLIWVSASFPFLLELAGPFHESVDDSAPIPRGGRVFEAESRRALEALNNADVAVYPVDARALVPKHGDEGAKRQGFILGGPPALFAIPNPSQMTGWDSMDLLADRSGGRAFFNTNDLSGAIRRALEDSDAAYTLGFYVDSATLDSKFHSIRVEVDRSGLELHYRKGYYALPAAPPDQPERTTRIQNALWSPLDSAGISLDAHLDIVDQPVKASRRVTLTIDPADVVLDRQSGRWSGTIDVVFARRAKDGRDLGSTTETVRMDFDDQLYDRLRKQGFLLIRTLEPSASFARLRIVVYDRTSGRLGSLELPMKD